MHCCLLRLQPSPSPTNTRVHEQNHCGGVTHAKFGGAAGRMHWLVAGSAAFRCGPTTPVSKGDEGAAEAIQLIAKGVAQAKTLRQRTAAGTMRLRGVARALMRRSQPATTLTTWTSAFPARWETAATAASGKRCEGYCTWAMTRRARCGPNLCDIPQKKSKQSKRRLIEGWHSI